ncbi:MAG TPA: c-type cytochrome [Pyrinomonadaceae bacterium]|jgi:mono/diheme cytochrome c family protein
MKRIMQAFTAAGLFVLLMLILWPGMGGSIARVRGAAEQTKDGAGAATRDARAIFESKCATCHGKDGRAKTFKAKFNKARDLTDAAWQAEVSDERIYNSVMGGRGKKMPAFAKKLSRAEVEGLVGYVRNLKK